MPTEQQRIHDEQLNREAFELCIKWQASRSVPATLPQISAFLAGVIAAVKFYNAQ